MWWLRTQSSFRRHRQKTKADGGDHQCRARLGLGYWVGSLRTTVRTDEFDIRIVAGTRVGCESKDKLGRRRTLKLFSKVRSNVIEVAVGHGPDETEDSIL